MKNANLKSRLLALFFDYLYILLYLFLLFALSISFYYLFFDGIPEFTEKQSHWIAFLFTVLPISIFFTIKESRKPFASFGKKRMNLKVIYSRNTLMGSIIRNILKFTPWQLAHIAVIKGIYNGFDSYYVMVFYGLGVLLPIVYIGMVGFRKDHRHLPDILARSQVIINEESR